MYTVEVFDVRLGSLFQKHSRHLGPPCVCSIVPGCGIKIWYLGMHICTECDRDAAVAVLPSPIPPPFSHPSLHPSLPSPIPPFTHPSLSLSLRSLQSRPKNAWRTRHLSGEFCRVPSLRLLLLLLPSCFSCSSCSSCSSTSFLSFSPPT